MAANVPERSDPCASDLIRRQEAGADGGCGRIVFRLGWTVANKSSRISSHPGRVRRASANAAAIMFIRELPGSDYGPSVVGSKTTAAPGRAMSTGATPLLKHSALWWRRAAVTHAHCSLMTNRECISE